MAPDVRYDDFDALAIAGSVSSRILIGRLGGCVAITFSVLLSFVTLTSSGGTADRLSTGSAAALALSAGAFLVARPWLVPLWLMDLGGVLASGLLVLAAYYSPTMRPAMPGIYVVFGTILFAVRRWWVAALHITLLALSYAAVLLISPHVYAPVVRWVIVESAVVTSGSFIRWLVSRVAGLARDEHEAWREAERAGAELARASAAKSAFLARMSHELRTPLNVVLGFSELLSHRLVGPLDERQRGYVQDISESAHILIGLVDEVLDPDKVEQGEVELLMTSVDARQVIDDAVRMVRETATSRGVHVRVHAGPDIPPIYADQRKLRQVVVNLLVNAVKFTPAGGHVTVTAVDVGEALQIVVRDTGIGIDTDDLERIFEEYQQTGSRRDGTGLGLPLARRFVELHGGRIVADSTPGQGSTFTVAIPFRRTTGRAAPPAPPPVVEDRHSAFLTPGSPANRRLITNLGALMALDAAGVLLAIVLFAPMSWARRWESVGLMLVALAIAVGMRQLASRLPVRGVEMFGAAGVVGITVLTEVGGQFAPLVPLAYGWVTMATFGLWPRRRAAGHLVAILALYTGVLLINPERHPVAEVLSNVNVILTNGAVCAWVLTKLRRLVSAKQTAHQRAEAIRSRLDSATRHKSAFLANMSHELRTPLNAVVGFAELLATEVPGPLTHKQREYVEDICTSARHLLALINDILDLAKIEAGQMSLSSEPVVVRSVLEDAVRRAGAAAATRGITVRLSNADPSLVVLADQTRLTQILDGLVSNAVKFTPDGGHVEVYAHLHAGDLVLAVRDDGIGVLPEQRQSIFEAFNQGPQLSTDRVPEGAGVGLSLVKGLVELHGGRVSVHNAPGRGSEFVVTLPAVDELAALQQPVSSQPTS